LFPLIISNRAAIELNYKYEAEWNRERERLQADQTPFDFCNKIKDEFEKNELNALEPTASLIYACSMIGRVCLEWVGDFGSA